MRRLKRRRLCVEENTAVVVFYVDFYSLPAKLIVEYFDGLGFWTEMLSSKSIRRAKSRSGNKAIVVQAKESGAGSKNKEYF